MRRRFSATLAMAVLALALPTAVLADGLPDPGHWDYLDASGYECIGPVCYDVTVDFTFKDGAINAGCIHLTTYVDFSQQYLVRACPTSGVQPILSKKFVVGFQPIDLVFLNNADEWEFTFPGEAATTITGPAVKTTGKEPWPGPCGGTWTGRQQTVPIQGTVTIGGIVIHVTGESSMLDAKVRAAC